MKLHYALGTVAGAVAIALHEAGLPFEPVAIDFTGGEQNGAAFRAKNPKGRVPLLETPDGLLTETPAILDYIGALAPAAGLVPDHPYQAAQMRALMSYLGSTLHVNHAHRFRGHRWASTEASFEDMRAKVPASMTECAQFLETTLAFGPFALGDQVTLADGYLYVTSGWLAGDGVDMTAFPKLTAYRDFYGARPAVKAAQAQGIVR